MAFAREVYPHLAIRCLGSDAALAGLLAELVGHLRWCLRTTLAGALLEYVVDRVSADITA